MRNKRIFIGSSTESKGLAERIKITLEKTYKYIKCDLWYEDFFLTGDFVFTDLITRSIAYDYAVLLGNGDDDVFRRSTKQKRVSRAIISTSNTACFLRFFLVIMCCFSSAMNAP